MMDAVPLIASGSVFSSAKGSEADTGKGALAHSLFLDKQATAGRQVEPNPLCG